MKKVIILAVAFGSMLTLLDVQAEKAEHASKIHNMHICFAAMGHTGNHYCNQPHYSDELYNCLHVFTQVAKQACLLANK